LRQTARIREEIISKHPSLLKRSSWLLPTKFLLDDEKRVELTFNSPDRAWNGNLRGKRTKKTGAPDMRHADNFSKTLCSHEEYTCSAGTIVWNGNDWRLKDKDTSRTLQKELEVVRKIVLEMGSSAQTRHEIEDKEKESSTSREKYAQPVEFLPQKFIVQGSLNLKIVNGQPIENTSSCLWEALQAAMLDAEIPEVLGVTDKFKIRQQCMEFLPRKTSKVENIFLRLCFSELSL